MRFGMSVEEVAEVERGVQRHRGEGLSEETWCQLL